MDQLGELIAILESIELTPELITYAGLYLGLGASISAVVEKKSERHQQLATLRKVRGLRSTLVQAIDVTSYVLKRKDGILADAQAVVDSGDVERGGRALATCEELHDLTRLVGNARAAVTNAQRTLRKLGPEFSEPCFQLELDVAIRLRDAMGRVQEYLETAWNRYESIKVDYGILELGHRIQGAIEA